MDVYEKVLTRNVDGLSTCDPSTILDAIWLADTVTSDMHTLLSALLSNSIIPVALAKERLELDLLERAGVIESAVLWQRKQIRINTGLLYKQQRFNLYREESEGYARLLSTLLLSHDDVDLGEKILALIGTFDLDPNRVVEAIFEVASIEGRYGLLRVMAGFGFSSATLASIIGCKLKKCSANYDARHLEGVFMSIALCLKEGLLTSIGQIWPHLDLDPEPVQKSTGVRQATDMLVAHDTGSAIPVDHSHAAYLCASLLQVGLMAEYEAVWPYAANRWNPYLLTVLCRNNQLERVGELGLYFDHEFAVKLLRAPCSVEVVLGHVLPAMSISYGNTFLSCELWTYLQQLPYPTRFGLYATWRRLPSVQLAQKNAQSDLRRLLRRLSRENVKQYGRLLGKLAHSNPTAVFPLLLEQCQAYDNLIGPVIDSCKYLTGLDFDVLLWSVLEQLQSRILSDDGMKEDATNAANWLQRLAGFVASLFRRFGMDIGPLLEFVLGRMCAGVSVEGVCILEELLHKLAGIEPKWDISDAQTDAACIGPLLRAQMTEAALKKSCAKLAANLQPYLPRLWPLLAAQRGHCEHAQSSLKLASTLVDRATSCFLQLTEFASLPDVALVAVDDTIEVALGTKRTIWRTIQRKGISNATEWIALSPMELFWMLDLGDLVVPVGRYHSEIARLRTAALLRQQQGNNNDTLVVIEGELRIRTALAVSLSSHIEQLPIDDAASFIQEAIVPRVLLSIQDAVYTAKFISLLHDANNTIALFLNGLLPKMDALLIACTEREARSLGRFLSELPSPLTSVQLVAIATACLPMLVPRGEYQRLRSAILVLNALSTQFRGNDSLIAALKTVHEDDNREDIHVMSLRCMTGLLPSSTTVNGGMASLQSSMDTIEDGEERVGEKRRQASPRPSVTESPGKRLRQIEVDSADRQARRSASNRDVRIFSSRDNREQSKDERRDRSEKLRDDQRESQEQRIEPRMHKAEDKTIPLKESKAALREQLRENSKEQPRDSGGEQSREQFRGDQFKGEQFREPFRGEQFRGDQFRTKEPRFDRDTLPRNRLDRDRRPEPAIRMRSDRELSPRHYSSSRPTTTTLTSSRHDSNRDRQHAPPFPSSSTRERQPNNSEHRPNSRR